MAQLAVNDIQLQDTDQVSVDDVRQLIQPHRWPCVSIYMPTHRRGPDIRQDPIRLRNLLDEAELKLTSGGMRLPEARDLLQPAREFLDAPDFWRHQSDGLAIFIMRDDQRLFRLPIHFDELTIVNDRFHLKPLFPMLTGDGLFYIVGVSLNETRLLRCTRGSYQEIQSPVLPQGIETIMRFIEEQKQLQWHTETGPAPTIASGSGLVAGERAAMFHGQGAGERHAKDRIFEYFRVVNDALKKLIPDRHVPMVFAGVEYLFPIFQEANEDFVLLDEFVPGNPDQAHGVRPEELHQRAWRIIEPYFAREREKAAKLFRTAAGAEPSRVAVTIDDAVQAAHDGRIEYLFVPIDQHVWGFFDPASRRVEVHKSPQKGDEDLLDFAATRTFMHRGVVYVVPANDMPEPGREIAALLRY